MRDSQAASTAARRLASSLRQLAQGRAERTRRVQEFLAGSHAKSNVAHGVFYYAPEYCGPKTSVTSSAFEHARFVFVFGTFDNRLMKLNRTKYLPFPLGPTKDWRRPRRLLLDDARPLLASFRGSKGSSKIERSWMAEHAAKYSRSGSKSGQAAWC
jgi:hypothetical protein